MLVHLNHRLAQMSLRLLRAEVWAEKGRSKLQRVAAEMAKLSLWLLTLAKDKPFEFLDHSIRCGDSLVGLHNIDQLRHFSLKPDADDAVLFKGPLDSAVDEAITLRLKLEDMPANTVEDVEASGEVAARRPKTR